MQLLTNRKIRLYLIILSGVFLSWDSIIGNIIIGLTTLFSILSLIKNKVPINQIFSLKYFISTGVVLFYIVGVFYSSDINYGLSFVQTTISLLFFPLFFIGVNFSKSDLIKIILSFMLSFALRSFYLIISLVIEVYKNNFTKNWYFQKIEELGGFHPTYMGLYAIVSIILSIYLISLKIKNSKIYIIIIFNIMLLFVLASRMALVTLLIISIIYLTYLYKSNINLRKYILFGSIISLFSLIILFISNEDLQFKFIQLRNINGFKYNKYDASSIASRIAKWEAAVNIYKENNLLIGTGTGDLPNDLMLQFKKIDCLQCRVKKYNNPHNQYLDSLSRNGILGLFFLLTMLFFPLFKSLKDKNIFQMMFIITFVFMFVSECALNREKGVQLFGFFYSFFYFLEKKMYE